MRELCALIVLSLMTAAPSRAEQPAAAEQAVRDTVLEYTAAYRAELPKYFSYFDPDTVMWWSSRGRVTVQEYQEMTKTRKPFELTRADDLRVRVAPSGDAAVASYVLVLKSPGQAQRTVDMMATLFRQGTGWKIVSLYVAQPPKPRPASR